MTSRKKLSTILRLGAWFGPWSSEKKPNVHSHTVHVPYEKKEISLKLFLPVHKKPYGAVFLIPGLHFQGADHDAIVRIASIIAHAGFFVGVPSLPDFISLRITPEVMLQVEHSFLTFVHLDEHPNTSTCITSISFGCLPAFSLASTHHLQHLISGVITFGGYLEWKPVMKFCLDETPGVPCDHRNFPIVFILLSQYWKEEYDVPAVLHAWDRYIHQTWLLCPKPNEYQRRAIALPIAHTLPQNEQKLFLDGCGLTKDWHHVSNHAIKEQTDLNWLNNHTRVEQMVCPIVSIHAMTDEIVPAGQAKKLYTCGSNHPYSRTYCTGIYGHSGQNTSQSLSTFILYKELRTLLSILRTLTHLSCALQSNERSMSPHNRSLQKDPIC